MINNTLNDIREKHKIRVPRSKQQITLIFGVIFVLLGTLTVTSLVVGKIIVSQVIGQLYPLSDQAGCDIITEYPMVWSRDKDYKNQTIRLAGGIFNFSIGETRQRYYFIMELKDGLVIKSEVTQEQYEAIGFWDGLAVEYIKGKYSGEYYIKRIYPAQKNNFKARLWSIICD